MAAKCKRPGCTWQASVDGYCRVHHPAFRRERKRLRATSMKRRLAPVASVRRQPGVLVVALDNGDTWAVPMAMLSLRGILKCRGGALSEEEAEAVSAMMEGYAKLLDLPQKVRNETVSALQEALKQASAEEFEV